MGKESIVQRIISDAENEAAAIIAEAEERAKAVIAEAEERARRNLAGTKAEAEKRAKAILDGRSATARLDCAKIELAEKRRAVDAVYSSALKKLNALDDKQALKLAQKLLEEYAEDGDEIVFASGYKHAAAVAKLDIVAERGLKVSKKTGDISGGFVLRGRTSDKDVSYGALLEADREANVSSVADKMFVTE